MIGNNDQSCWPLEAFDILRLLPAVMIDLSMPCS